MKLWFSPGIGFFDNETDQTCSVMAPICKSLFCLQTISGLMPIYPQQDLSDLYEDNDTVFVLYFLHDLRN